MRYDTIETFRRTLFRTRDRLLKRRRRALAEEQELLAEREPDWEDAAALETAATVLDTLTETERKGLARIQSSLQRMGRGTYGECISCGEAIDQERLKLVPATDRCARCAQH
jgi:RNA polymerase-binding protein DksA